MACGACKFRRRKCTDDCVFAPYFSCNEEGIAQFGAIHRVFRTSYFSKLLHDLPSRDQRDAAIAILYEAEVRLRDPVHGSVSIISALQRESMSLKDQVTNLKDQNTNLKDEVTSLEEKLEITNAELSASRRLNPGHYFNSHIPDNVNGKQHEEIFNANITSSPYEHHHLPRGNQQSSPSQHVVVNNYRGDAAMMDESNYFAASNVGQHRMSNEELAIGHAHELAASGSFDGALLNPDQYLNNGKQREIFNADTTTVPYQRHHLPRGMQESNLSQHVAVNNYDAVKVSDSLDGALLNLDRYLNSDFQQEIFNAHSTTISYEQHHLPKGNQESIPSQHVAVNNYDADTMILDNSNYLHALGQHNMSNEEHAIGYAEVKASGSLNGALLNPGQYLSSHIADYENGNQPGIFNANSNANAYEQHHFTQGNQESIPFQHVAVNNYHADAAMVEVESNYFPSSMLGQHSMSNDMGNLATGTDEQYIGTDAIDFSLFY